MASMDGHQKSEPGCRFTNSNLFYTVSTLIIMSQILAHNLV